MGAALPLGKSIPQKDKWLLSGPMFQTWTLLGIRPRPQSIRQAQKRRTVNCPEVPPPVRESIDSLLSVLNKKQRRLYLGLESL
jgi:hypothetical protein